MSADLYRYLLQRSFPGPGGTIMWVMLNPSTATNTMDDPTIRRCMGFARGWGFSEMTVGNLFARRATSPKDLLKAQDPVGPHNDEMLVQMASEADLIVAAWGNHGSYRGRDRRVLFLLKEYDIFRLGALTAKAQPRHPLYVAGSTDPVLWQIKWTTERLADYYQEDLPQRRNLEGGP